MSIEGTSDDTFNKYLDEYIQNRNWGRRLAITANAFYPLLICMVYKSRLDTIGSTLSLCLLDEVQPNRRFHGLSSLLWIAFRWWYTLLSLTCFVGVLTTAPDSCYGVYGNYAMLTWALLKGLSLLVDANHVEKWYRRCSSTENTSPGKFLLSVILYQ